MSSTEIEQVILGINSEPKTVQAALITHVRRQRPGVVHIRYHGCHNNIQALTHSRHKTEIQEMQRASNLPAHSMNQEGAKAIRRVYIQHLR